MTAGSDDDVEDSSEPNFADVMNGFSFDSSRAGKRRRWGRRRGEDVELPDDSEPSADAVTLGQVPTPPQGQARPQAQPRLQPPPRLQAPEVAATRSTSGPTPIPIPIPIPMYPPEPMYQPAQVPRPEQADEPEPPAEPNAAAIRPYAWTRGRTKSGFDLAIETLVSTSQRGREQMAVLQIEHRAVAQLCGQTRSVAEVAALLTLPLGVARVVLGDMAGLGLVMVHQTISSAGNAPDLALMERVLSGLRRL